MAKAISDSSTLIHLCSIRRLNLLRGFYKEITISPAVWKEVVEEGENRPGSERIREAKAEKWIKIVEPSDKLLLRFLKSQLDEGEAEAITLAVELKADVVFLDESDARKIADIYEIKKTGVIGILIRAKKHNKISSLRKELDKLAKKGNFWIDDKIIRKALKEVGEEGDS